ncbi:hypothetical protein K432DRAFT_406715 [Lepidopterella palustris CBS 459.81]|uniref:C2H2-type domain-containing protein n=1 Tax=Lepidopterella palustris CBS 459.81 TaxID=1314670 RepID=A0A8E2JD99_9PEZI|nr:hypothetical protein K432DRAFT_406715 [Lepidopterella palustris CBS 459.81]
MVHGSGRDREAHDHRQHQYQHQHQHQHQHPNYYPQPQSRVHRPRSDGSPVQVPNHYSNHQAVAYQYQRAPQSPPSPPVEEASKPSLPSISSLLGIADGDRASESVGQSPNQPQHQQPPQGQQEPQPQNIITAQQSESRPDQLPQAFGQAIVSNPRMTLPPTPPMQPDSVVDGNQSPSNASNTSSVTAQPYYLGQSLNNMEPHQQRQHVPSAPPLKRHSIQSQPAMSPYNASPYAASPYVSSPGAASSASFYSPENHTYTSAALYQQRPLPSNFPPQVMPIPVPASPANGSNLWQHHHYISASSQAAFPQSQDRYICQTCNKAFSRPSSLRIHSHSHTGEKPYKCPQPGCGKAFSVRSNMKRHERGCHASAGNAITAS